MIAATAAADIKALAFKTELLTGPHAGRNPDRLFSIQCRYFERGSQRSLPWRDRNFGLRIVTFDCERRMRFHFQAYEKIAAVQPAAGHADAAVVTGSGWNADFDRLLGVADAYIHASRRAAMHVFERQGHFGFSLSGRAAEST